MSWCSLAHAFARGLFRNVGCNLIGNLYAQLYNVVYEHCLAFGGTCGRDSLCTVSVIVVGEFVCVCDCDYVSFFVL